MKIKKLFSFCLLICFMLSATGCGDALIDLTEQEEDTIVLYSAKMVTKFNILQPKGLCNVYVREGELDYGDEPSVPESSGFPEAETGDDVLNNLDQLFDQLSGNDSGQNTSGEANTSGGATNTAGTHESGLSLTDTLDVPGLTFTLSEFMVTELYAAEDYFVVTARNGCKYLVLNVEAKNESNSPVQVNMASRKSKYYLTVNNAYKQASQTTILLNDLATYEGVIGAGESKDLTMLFMFPTDQLNEINTINFTVETDGNTRSTLF